MNLRAARAWCRETAPGAPRRTRGATVVRRERRTRKWGALSGPPFSQATTPGLRRVVGASRTLEVHVAAAAHATVAARGSTRTGASAAAALGGDDVVDAQDHGCGLGRRADRLHAGAHGLDDIELLHVIDLAGVHVDSGALLALLVGRPEVQ